MVLAYLPRCERPDCRNPSALNTGGPCFWHKSADRELQRKRDAAALPPVRRDHCLEAGLPDPPSPKEIESEARRIREHWPASRLAPGRGPKVYSVGLRRWNDGGGL